MMELFIAGLLFGLLMGALIMRNHRESKIERLRALLMEQHQLILMQDRLINQEDTDMMSIHERARRLEKHCHMCNRLEMMTDRGLIVVKIFDDHGKAVRVTYKDGEPVDIQRAPDELLRPINPRWKDFEFGGF